MTGLFCFGLGYVAKQLADKYPFWRCMGTQQTRLPQQKPSPVSLYQTVIFDEKEQFDPHILDKYNYFLISIPPADGADFVLKHYRDYFKSRGNSIHWIGYLSATNVYGHHDGAWVDETTLPTPLSQKGIARLHAEQEWLNLYQTSQCPVHIFRLSSVYGPGRSPLEKILYSQVTLIDKIGHLFSRIHVSDICRVLTATIEQPQAGQIFNLADDLPAENAVVMEHAHTLLGISPSPRIPFEEAEISDTLREYYNENKRVKNEKIKQKLGISLIYPTYREGLQNCLEFIDANLQKKIHP